VQWIEDGRLALIAAFMAGDHFASADDHHLVHIALHHHLAVSIFGGHGVIVRTIAHQRQRGDASGDFLAGIKRGSRQRQQCGAIALEPFADGLSVSAQPPLASLHAAFMSDMSIISPSLHTA
jgi:hypothetical protein